MEDLKLVQKCQEGELQYFSQLYDRYIDKIYKFIYLKTFDKQIAEDLTSEVFMKSLSKIDTLDVKETSSFQAWLYTIAGNKVKDYYKTNKNDQTLEEYLEVEYTENLAQQIDDKDKLQQILEYIKNLREDHKHIILLRIWDDLSYSEIAQITGVSLDNCKKIVSRTLKNIAANFALLIILLILI